MGQLAKNDIIGKTFGKLTVEKFHDLDKWKKSRYFCKCKCENYTVVNRSDLLQNKTKSCGQCSNNTFIFEDNLVRCYTLKNEEFLIDKEDFDKIKNITWSINSTGYVVGLKNKKFTRLHRLILNEIQTNNYIDHINHNKLDNRKINLRIGKSSNNQMNQKLSINNTSGVKGVSWCNTNNGWRSYITINKKRINLGTFSNLKDAVKARYEAELKYFGEYRDISNDKHILQIINK